MAATIGKIMIYINPSQNGINNVLRRLFLYERNKLSVYEIAELFRDLIQTGTIELLHPKYLLIARELEREGYL